MKKQQKEANESLNIWEKLLFLSKNKNNSAQGIYAIKHEEIIERSK
jgi:hypothetical protein